MQVNVPLVLIREGGKLPPPTACVLSHGSHILSMGSHDGTVKIMEMEDGLFARDAFVIILNHVLAITCTFCVLLQLLEQVGISPEKTQAIVVAGFLAHGGWGFCTSRVLEESLSKAFWSWEALRRLSRIFLLLSLSSI
jgi:hypothetical protein